MLYDRALFALEERGALDEAVSVIAERIPELKSLSMEEKLMLVRELWDELSARPDAFPPREDHVKLLQERLDHFRQYPNDVVAWEEVKARILGSR